MMWSIRRLIFGKGKGEKERSHEVSSIKGIKKGIRRKRRKKINWAVERQSILYLPDEILLQLLETMEYRELATMAIVNKKFKELNKDSHRWKKLFEERWGAPSNLTKRASKLAGGWHKLFRAKHIAEKESAPWLQPSQYEIQAMLEYLTTFEKYPGLGCPSKVMISFLVDGSGSVTEEDFSTMQDFMVKTVKTVNKSTTGSKFSIIQFSNDVRVEMPLDTHKTSTFASTARKMTRMNGGTNIAAALDRASRLAYPHNQVDVPHMILLLTDGRVDSYQAREAVQRAKQCAEEVPNVAFFAFAVGRSVDKNELIKIVETTCGQMQNPQDRILDLRTLDEPPW